MYLDFRRMDVRSLAIKYSTLANFVLFSSSKDGYPSLSWRIPSCKPLPAPSLPRVLPATKHLFVPLNFNVLRDTLASFLPGFEGVSDLERGPSMRRLTVVPQHMKDANATFLLDAGENPNIRVLLSTYDGHFELKRLGFSLDEFRGLWQCWNETKTKEQKLFTEWYKREGCKLQNQNSDESDLSD